MARPVFAHALKHNVGSSRPNRVLFFDCETTAVPVEGEGIRQDLKLVIGHYWRRQTNGKADTHEWATFTEARPFLDWLSSKVNRTHKLVVTSHNLGIDMPVLGIFSYLARQDWTVRGFYEKGGTRIIRFVRDTSEWASWQAQGHSREDFKGRKTWGTIMFVDNHNFFRGSLARWGKIIGQDKLEIDFDTCSPEELERYCRNDVEILVKLWSWWFDFLDLHDLGSWKHTIPSQAFTAFRHRFVPLRIWIHHNPAAEELARQAYKGGLVEALRVGTFEEGPFYKLDVNSMYPYVMRNKSYPCDLALLTDGKTPAWLARAIKKRCLIAEVLVEVPRRSFPILMHGKNVYPVGEFWTTLATPELKLALDNGWVKEVGRIAVHRSGRIFEEYVDFFYDLKAQYSREGETALRELTKLFLNSLYGKWGQFSQGLEKIDTCPPDEYCVYPCYNVTSGHQEDYYKIGGTVFVQGEKLEAFNSYPAIAAHVTAEARLYLLSLVDKAGRQNVYYCDTDSLIVNQAGYDRLLPLCDDSALGALKLEGQSDTLTIHGRKDYLFGGHTTLKGIRPSADQVAPNTYRQEVFPSIKGGMRRFGREVVIVYEVVKVLARLVNWGKLQDDGKVQPYRLTPAEPNYKAIALKSQIDVLREALTIPAEVMFEFWDYGKGAIRRQRDKYGELVLWPYAKTDDAATEYGYRSAQDFVDAVTLQAHVYEQIRQLERQLREIEG